MPVAAPAPVLPPPTVTTAPTPPLPPVVWERATRVELCDLPQLVWIGDGTRPDEVAREHAIFSGPKTNLGSHAFRLVRISAADAARDARLAAWAGFSGPTLVALSADGAKARVITPELMVPRPVWGAMKEVTQVTFTDDLETIVAEARRNLAETERLEAERLAVTMSRLAETDRQTRLAAIGRRRTELEAALRSLWTLHPRKSA